MKPTTLLFYLLLLSGILFPSAANSQQVSLSSQAEISVMTLGPYQGEIYSAFGHTAIHLKDPMNRVDWVFNYGVFDFDQENFFWNFARGKLLYQLGLSDYGRFVNHYIGENRYVIEQYLNLTQQEKQEMVDFLVNNYKPENREYNYNYVYDNCSSKVPEILGKIFPGRIDYNHYFVKEGTTVRDLMDEYLVYQPWGDWIIDVGLGYEIDKEAAPETYMFLPDYVKLALDSARLSTDSSSVPLVQRTDLVYQSKPEEQSNGVFTPFNTFILVFFIIGFFTNRDFKREKRSHWVDVVLFTFVGILAWWLVFLWSATDHLSKENMNIFWAIPFHIPLVYFLNTKKLRKFSMIYFQLVGIWYLILLLIWEAIPQPLHNALLPLVITMILRCFYIAYDLRKKLKVTTK
ncbi:MAG: DUF4105 domain-containing protein [Cyclobacteriaceae bacterium]